VVAAADGVVCTLLGRTLQGLGAVVISAQSGPRALELAEQHWPDAIVADALLPDLGGFELCRRLRLDMLLADTPVALVLWKDELLDRARHVDATLQSASGAIEPSSVARELEEALIPRANLERRLAAHEPVGGRLDGITPRLILELARARAPNALLVVHCGSVRFEVVLSDGRIARASAFDARGMESEGPRVFATFLGLRRGRFTLEPRGDTPAAGIAAELKALTSPIVSRSRRAREVIESPELDNIQRVVLDPLAIAVFLDDSGGTERSLVERLASGSSPGSLRNVRGWDDVSVAPVQATLLELARRGAIQALLDLHGRDLLDAGSADSEPIAPSTPPAAAVLELGEVVRQAVSRSPLPPLAEAAPAATEGAPAPRAAVPERAPEAPPEELRGAEPEPDSERDAAAPNDAQRPSSGERPTRSDLRERELPPDTELEGAALADAREDDGAEELDVTWPPSTRSKVRAAAVPFLITLSAAAAAFVAVRALGEGGWQTLRAALRSSSAEAPVADAGSAELEPPQTSAVAAAPQPAAGSEEDLAAERQKVPVDVLFESEVLELPLQVRLRPGQGLLEVRTWERQQIYVDGVFMGNYESRLIPLVPGTYQVRLRDGGRHIERSVEVRAGQRTRLSARPKSATPR
jgi:CheY-like chemotaxis protein